MFGLSQHDPEHLIGAGLGENAVRKCAGGVRRIDADVEAVLLEVEQNAERHAAQCRWIVPAEQEVLSRCSAPDG